MQSKRLDSNFFNYLFIYSLAEKSPITDQSYDILEIPFPVARVTLSCNYKKKQRNKFSSYSLQRVERKFRKIWQMQKKSPRCYVLRLYMFYRSKAN